MFFRVNNIGDTSNEMCLNCDTNNDSVILFINTQLDGQARQQKKSYFFITPVQSKLIAWFTETM